MIERYSRPLMAQMWKPERRFDYMLTVEQAVAKVQAQLKIIPNAAARDIHKKGAFNVKEIYKIEKVTKHDVIAFVSSVAKAVGPNGRYVHFGLTSSDVLDTALSLQIKEAGQEISKDLDVLLSTLKGLIKKHKKTFCAGRTHGMHAEPTTFGYKLSGFYFEFKRAQDNLNQVLKESCRCKLSGAVGTYSALSQKVEDKVAKNLKLTPEVIATQVIPRDRHAKVIGALCYIGLAIERLAVELRHLQRTEVGEVIEGFTPGQKGSSAMPHKKNPISGENLTGLSRLLKAYYQSALENVPLWHERDISHSSVERVIFGDSFIVADYAIDRMNTVLKNLYVDEKRMKHNLSLSGGMLFSSHVLLHLVDKGLSREEAYAHTQRLSHSLNYGEHLKDKIAQDSIVSKYFTKKELSSLFAGDTHLASILKKLASLKL